MNTTAKPTNSQARDILHIGVITGAHGLQGELKIMALTDDLNRFNVLNDCLIVSSDEKERVPAQAVGARFFNTQVILRIKGVHDRTTAELLKGKLISVTRENAVVLPPETWFVCDLLGCAIYDEAHGLLGVLTDIQPNAAQDVYVVTQPKQKDLLFPAIKSILRHVDIIAKRIDVVLPDGLYEIYREN
ncbi:MAG: ribosome maturation factor RimM [Eubacteriales bacterium]|nr:ribosome maturation factor RimM [Eubacteriales bacterium]